MDTKFLLAALAASSLASAAAAQCPRQRATTVPDSVTMGPVVQCGGVKVDIPGLQLTTFTGCPVAVTAVPEHEVATGVAESQTQVEVVAQIAGRLITLSCQPTYFLFVRVGSSCEITRDVAFGAYLRLVTKPCATP